MWITNFILQADKKYYSFQF